MDKRFVQIVVIVALSVGPATGGMAETAARRRVAVDKAVERGAAWLAGQIDDDGKFRHEPAATHDRYGGQTALCLYALLASGRSRNDPVVARGLKWLADAKLNGTYAISMRIHVFSSIKDDKYLPLIQQDVRWLIKAARRDGSYTYTMPDPNQQPPAFDNSNAQMAVLGVWQGRQRGVSVPRAYWVRVFSYWKSQQLPDGGWNYVVRNNDMRHAQPAYGSMTAAGLATMFICMDALAPENNADVANSSIPKIIDNGMGWLENNFSVRENPKKGVEWYYYWLYSLERVGRTSGYKRFGYHDWYAEGVRELLRLQQDSGAWGLPREAHTQWPVADTAFATLFLARGRNPIMVNKLQYPGRWDYRPRDAAYLARWIGYIFEQPVNWQVVSIDARQTDLDDAPILYISGAGPVEMTDAQVDKLRQFVLRGGLIVSEASGNNGDFTMDMRKIYQRAFPEYSFRRLPDDHPIYNLHFKVKDIRGLSGVSNGARLLAIHSPRDLSQALQSGATRTNRPFYDLMANIHLYASDSGTLPPRGSRTWPTPEVFTAKTTIHVTPVRYKGNWNPEPLALTRLTTLAGNRYHVYFIVDKPADLAKLDAYRNPIAVMTGTDDFTPTAAETAALKKYFRDGGVLVVDAAGGSEAFAADVEKHILPLVPDGMDGLVTREELAGGPAALGRIQYRRNYANGLGTQKKYLRLQPIVRGDGRLAIVFSPEDITCGLVGFPRHGMKGYAPDTAVPLMTDLLWYIASQPAPTTQPTAEVVARPTTQPAATQPTGSVYIRVVPKRQPPDSRAPATGTDITLP